MLTPLALFITLLIATAFIAHWSDNLGKKLGKKRVSVFGLRPRTSATLLTVASSWVIMIFTMSALLLVVPQLRRALFRYESERTRLLDQAADAQSQTEAARRALKVAATQKQELEDSVGRVRADLLAAQAQKTTAQTQAAVYQQQAKTAKHGFQTAQNNFQIAQRNLQSARRGEQLARGGEATARRGAQVALGNEQRARQSAIAARKQEQAARAALQKARTALQYTQTRLARGEARLKSANMSLATVNAQLGNTQTQLVKSYKDVVASFSQVAQAKKEVGAARIERDRLRKEVKGLREDVGQAQLAAIRYGDLADTLAFSDIRVPVDKTLAERRFDATSQPEEIARQLRILIKFAGDAVSDKGGLVPRAEFVVGAAIADPVTKRPIELSQDETVQVYARALSSANQTVSARLVSAFNYPATTTRVVARFVFIPIRTIYSARQTIIEAPIDARKTESAIFGDLQRLVDDARQSAVKRGASPPLSTDDDKFFDGDTGPKLFDALRQVQKVGRPVTVRVVAARDLDSAEPLQVRFVVGETA